MYDRLLRYLRTNRFSDAAHAAGVLSHYFTDPFQPLHTQICQRSAIVHRPFEWTLQLAYEDVLACWRNDQMRVVFHLSDRPEWLGEAILHGARFANRKYQRILDQYQLSRAIDRPDHGLTVELRESMAELFGTVITGWARVLERTALDAEAVRVCPLPAASVSPALLDALLRAPLARLQRHASSRRQQRTIEALYAEYTQTGRLQKHLPTEIDVVQRVIDVYHRERQWKHRRDQSIVTSQQSLTSNSVDTSQSSENRSPKGNPSPSVVPFAQKSAQWADQNTDSKSDQTSLNQPPRRNRAA